MKNRVFILSGVVKAEWKKETESSPAKMESGYHGNLEDLNLLLDQGWLIKETIMLKVSDAGLNEGEIQSIVYNLEKPTPSSSRKN